MFARIALMPGTEMAVAEGRTGGVAPGIPHGS
jgi:hypothetical protein